MQLDRLIARDGALILADGRMLADDRWCVDMPASESIELIDEIARRCNAFPAMLNALKDAYPYVADSAMRAQIGDLIAKAEGQP
jgi:hypothetical protein